MISWEWIALISALIYAAYKWGTWNYEEFQQRGMVFPKPTFFVGNHGPFMFGRASLADQSLAIYKQFDGHRAIGFFNFMRPTVYVRDPEVIKLITVKDFDRFTDHDPFVKEEDDLLFGKSLFALRGQRWKSMRNTLSPAFTSSKMKGMFQLVAKCGEQLGDYLEDKCKAEKSEVLSLEMKDLFTRYANDVIATSAFGIRCDSLREPKNEFYEIGKEATNFGGWRALVFIGVQVMPRFFKLLGIKLTSDRVTNFFCSLVTNTMRVREKENIIRPDMIHLLMEARKGTLKGDEDDVQRDDAKIKSAELTDDDITSQAFLFFAAGFDTSSTLLSFVTYFLAVNPDIQERVRLEIDDIVHVDGGRLTYDGVQKMKYLDNVLSETLRFYPPVVDLDRQCLQDYTIPATKTTPKITIKKGDGIMIAAFGIHHDPEYYPDPERFDPDRFSDENKHNIHPFTYLPFGSGPRICIGSRFALMETKIAVISILSRFQLVTTAKTPIPIRLEKGTFNTSPEGGTWLGIKPRA